MAEKSEKNSSKCSNSLIWVPLILPSFISKRTELKISHQRKKRQSMATIRMSLGLDCSLMMNPRFSHFPLTLFQPASSGGGGQCDSFGRLSRVVDRRWRLWAVVDSPMVSSLLPGCLVSEEDDVGEGRIR
nr:hypothetical protein Iba_scaffold1242457CG0010 [Ipomoea batatas]